LESFSLSFVDGVSSYTESGRSAAGIRDRVLGRFFVFFQTLRGRRIASLPTQWTTLHSIRCSTSCDAKFMATFADAGHRAQHREFSPPARDAEETQPPIRAFATWACL